MSTPVGAVQGQNAQKGVKRSVLGNPVGVPTQLPGFRGRAVDAGGPIKAPKLRNGNLNNETSNASAPPALPRPPALLLLAARADQNRLALVRCASLTMSFALWTTSRRTKAGLGLGTCASGTGTRPATPSRRKPPAT